MRRPSSAGVFKITCPYCKHSFLLKIPATMASPAAQTQQSGQTGQTTEQSTQQPHSQEQAQAPDNSNAGLIKVEGEYFAGKKYEIDCPHCRNCRIRYTPQTIGVRGFRCPICKGQIAVEAKQGKTNPIDLGEDSDYVRGRIRQLKRFSRGIAYPLPVGRKTIIGREDAGKPSDFSIRGDSYVSRRSVEIDVQRGSKGYTFKLKVLNAANPVLHNNRQLSTSESVYLNFGDSLTLGKTKLVFERDV